MEWIANGFYLALGVFLFCVALWFVGMLVVGMVESWDEADLERRRARLEGQKVPSRSLWYRMGMLLGRLRRMIPHADEHGNPAGFTGR